MRARVRWVRGAALATLLGVALAAGGGPALARQGVYAGLGTAKETVTGGFDGGVRYTEPSGQNEIRAGKPEPATGLAFNGGFGLNDYVALDLLLNVSRHDSVYDSGSGTPQTYKTTLSAVQLGLKVGAPVGELGGVFGRAGLGGYELAYRANNIRIADQQAADDARFSGRGLAYGVGGEVFFGHWGVQLAYTIQNAEFKTVQSRNFAGDVKPGLSPTMSTLFVLLNYYVQ